MPSVININYFSLGTRGNSMAEKKQFIKDLIKDNKVDDMFSVKFKKPVRKSKNGFMFDVRVGDKTGEIAVKSLATPMRWRVRKVFDSILPGGVLRVKGKAQEYNEILEIAINPDNGDMIVALAEGEYRLEDFVPRTEKDIDQMVAQLNAYIKKVKDPKLLELLSYFFTDEEFVEEFKKCPAAITHHCNWIGGLLEHTLDVTTLCDTMGDMYPRMDRDRLAGAILHDIGKVHEYTVTTNIDCTNEGRLRGHIVIGSEMISLAIRNIPEFPDNLRLKISHIILSSHGELEYGSPKEPSFPEAVAIAQADTLDSRIQEIVRAKLDARTEDEWAWNKELGSIYLR